MRIIIKIGSSTLTHKTGKLHLRLIEKYIRVLSDLKNQGHEIILVSSGAMAVGAAKMNLPQKPEETPKKQAIAAVGQSELMSIYSRLFADYGCQVGQILLTKDVTSRDERRNNLINTFNALLGYVCIPIVNENDSVEVEEIKFGDNDTLSAIVAECIAADLLILLTDIDALYDGDPRENPNAEKIQKFHARFARQKGDNVIVNAAVIERERKKNRRQHREEQHVPEIFEHIFNA